MAFQCLLTRRAGPVEYLTLNRPEVRNAFNEALIADLTGWAAAIAADTTVRAVVLSGAGSAFCAGADLAWMARTLSYTHDENLRDVATFARMLAELDALPMPLISRVHGAAMGGGAGLLAVSDIVVAADAATFGFTEVALGLVPAVISPYVIAKIGASAARELFVSGTRIGAVRAREIGLVHAVVPDADIDACTGGYVRDVLRAAPGAIRVAKALVRNVAGRSPDAVADLTAQALATRRASPEGQEGIRAFLDKRRANWHVSPDPDR